MVMHPRTQIRHAVCALLATPTDPAPVYRTGAEDRIYATRTAPLHRRHMPAIMVMTEGERRDTGAPYHQPDGPVRRLLNLSIGAVTAGEDADDGVDTLCFEIERALMADPNLGGLCESVYWQETVLQELGDGNEFFLMAQMVFEVAYYTAVEEPETDIPTTVYGSWVPKIGIPHEPDYQDITDGRVPEIT